MIPMAYGRTDALGGAAAKTGGIDPRLKPAAHDFEASMMQELLKPMEHDPLFSSGNGDGGGLVTGEGGASGWSRLGAESLAKAISEAGGLGMATKVIAEVEAEAKQGQGAAAGDGKAGRGAASGATNSATNSATANNTSGNGFKRGEIPAAGAAERRIP